MELKIKVMENQTMLLNGNRYYWNKNLKKWVPESYKFELTK